MRPWWAICELKIVRNTFRRNRKLGKLNSLCGLYLLYKLVKIGNLYIGVFIWLGYTSAELKYVCFSLMFENNLSQMVRFRHLMSLKFNPNQFIDKIGCAYIWKCLWYMEVGGKLKWRNWKSVFFLRMKKRVKSLVSLEASSRKDSACN